MELLQQVGLVIRGAAVRSPMILGPMGQKWVCAAGVERSTLHRCGLTGLEGSYHKPFLSFINRALVGHFSGPGSRSGSHKKEMFLFAPQIQRKGSLSSWPICNNIKS